MSVPSMVHRFGDSLIVRSVVSGDALYGSADALEDPTNSTTTCTTSTTPPTKDLPECKVKRNYSCNLCDFFTQNPRNYLYHLRDVHDEKVKIYECPNCLYASKHFQKLLRHTKMVHGTSQVALPASHDDESKTRKRPASPPANDDTVEDEEHNESDEEADDGSSSSAALFKCSVCAFAARSRSQLGRHEREEHIKTKFFRCVKCTYVTHMKARFTKHVKYHSMPMIKCDMCDFRTPYKWNLDRHCKNHNGRGAFRCSACNFTADIKQSLTVHEMNHHVPPVGQAAGLGVGRRRNKVGASDATAAEEAAAAKHETKTDDGEQLQQKKKLKSSGQDQQQSRSYESDFIHPDDIIHRANGNVYIKNKCKLCNFKSAWPSEMVRHEQRVHHIVHNDSTVQKKCNEKQKTSRPIPNLIPLPAKKNETYEPTMSQQDIEDIYAKSNNSALKDLASLFDSEDVFENLRDSSENTSKIPDLIPTNFCTSTPKSDDSFKKKNASFFDRLKEKLMTTADMNLTCKYCGHESKCLTEQAKHAKDCKEGKRTMVIPPVHNISSSRCQYCRQRCKSSADLYNHLQTCQEAFKAQRMDDESENELKIDEGKSDDDDESKPHPMENRIFVWNNIEMPMDVETPENLDYSDDRIDDNVSLDLSIRTQSPGGSENSYMGHEYGSIPSHPTPTEKIPTHGNDISIAQHKRVFKCPHCSFWASTASRFHVHIVGHLNKKPFECSLCAYRSNWRWDITKHIKLKSVRDPAHESAKVLMTDETGRRNYTKYNKYLTEIHVSGEQSLETSGGSGTRPKHPDGRNASPVQNNTRADLPKLTRAPSGRDFSPLLKSPPLRPPPPLKAADGYFAGKDKKRPMTENKRTLFKCKKCHFRDASRDVLLEHVKRHYPQNGGTPSSSSGAVSGSEASNTKTSSPDRDEASVDMAAKGGQAPFRCGHCNQVSNWKHVIQRHCRLKHSGDIRVVTNKNGQEKVEMDEQPDEPDHVDVSQEGTFKCNSCPFSSNEQTEFEQHLTGHFATADSVLKCHYCKYFVSRKEDLIEHLQLHGVNDPDDAFLMRSLEKVPTSNENDSGKKFKCMTCPYVTNSKSQYTYHKQFHKPRGGQYTCTQCSYNVTKRHLLHQHLKVHGITATPQKQNGENPDMEEISEDIESVTMGVDAQNFADIPLVWVSKNGKFSKMFKCRFCPHVNLRKVNIQEHEKMHGTREKNPNTSRPNDMEHHCTECNYICNNAGVLSSHSKVHQGIYGTVHCLVDPVKTDEEQIRELSKFLNPALGQIETIDLDDCDENEMNNEEEQENSENLLYFCRECPARFLKEAEYAIHSKLHGVRLFYKCEYCTYSARQKPHLLAHNKVHTNEYQDRTRVLQTMYITSGAHSQPQIYPIKGHNAELIWIIFDNKTLDSPMVKVTKTAINVPLSGTELFQQKNEAQAAQLAKEPSPQPSKPADPQFGTLMHGNPKFIYPTYLKNGRMKEKRYKCHKCPSAFEKREQYKIHLSLHGSKQRYKCEHCDYSVKYYANYVQHIKKHKMDSDAHAAARSNGLEETAPPLLENDVEMQQQEDAEKKLKLSMSDQQAIRILQQRLDNAAQSPTKVETIAVEEKKTFWCPSCPYTNYRKDAVDNHQKRHINVSGMRSNFTCEHCDYSVPQAHFLRDHTRLHFTPNRNAQIDGYMVCDNLKLTSSRCDESDGSGDVVSDGQQKDVIFEEVGNRSDGREFLPLLNSETVERFNNNDGEKLFVDLEKGELVSKMENSDTSKTEES